MLKPWWERFPGRLEHELEALKAADIPFRFDEHARAAGIIKLEVHPTVEGQQLNLMATFPALYPYFRFEVQAPDLQLDHHQNPLAKNLCLIGRNTSNWSTEDTLAKSIQNQLPLVLEAARTDDHAAAAMLEEHQGEPVSNYYPYVNDAIVLVDSSWDLPTNITRGELEIGIQDSSVPVIRGVVLKIRDSRGTVLASADPVLRRLYPKLIRGRWFRVQALAHESDPRTFLESYAREQSTITQLMACPVKDWRMDVTGLVFPEELRYQQKGDGWIFVVRAEENKSRRRSKRAAYFARAGRAGRTDLSSRVPELATLSTRRVVIIGLGGIGGPSAIELARSGVGELRILDRDIIEPGTVVRWPLGISMAGLSKVKAIERFISLHYPYTTVLAHHHWIGNALGNDLSDLKVLDELLDGVDLIYDATAEIGFQYLLSDLAAERKVPYIAVSTTFGAWGGLIYRIRPGQTKGCWSCLQGHLDVSIPSPPADPDGKVQPQGCADPTFTGAGCDVAQIALAGVRVAIATLSHGLEGAYPDFTWDVARVAFRETDGRLIAPRWDTFSLPRHPECKCHGSQ
jgi:molybdopterin/thiamine biosynthesis adenylyltransferase